MDSVECPFCHRIAVGDFDENLSGPHTVVFEPLDPVTPGHVLVVPRQHVERATDSAYLAGKTMEHAALVALRTNCDTNVIISSGPAATQTVRHLHAHVIPRHEGDGLILPWSP